MAESGHSGHSGQESGPVSATSWTGHWDSPFVDPEMEEIMTSLILGETARQEQGDHEMDVCFGDPETESKLHRQRCEKKPGHKNFIAVRDLNPGHLPAPYNFQGFVDWVKFVATLTVRLFIRYTSANRPDSLGLTNLKGKYAVRVGSGYFNCPSEKQWSLSLCPFSDCHEGSGVHMVGQFTISTAAHVICDSEEAAKTYVEFFFDDDNDKSGVIKARGVSVEDMNLPGDFTYVRCATHDLSFWGKMQAKLTTPRAELVIPPDSSIAFAISHPHGCEKSVSFGEVVEVAPIEPDARFRPAGSPPLIPMCRLSYNVDTCPGSSGCNVMVVKKDQGGLRVYSAPHSRGAEVNTSGLGVVASPS